jgi:hypothetical protein
MTIARDGGGRWLPGGGSPNPAGRPALPADLRKQLVEAAPGAVQALVDLLQDGDARIRLLAAREILDRALGRPAVTVETSTQHDQAMAHYNLLVRQQVLDHLKQVHDQGGDVTDLETEDLVEILEAADEARKRGGKGARCCVRE